MRPIPSIPSAPDLNWREVLPLCLFFQNWKWLIPELKKGNDLRRKRMGEMSKRGKPIKKMWFRTNSHCRCRSCMWRRILAKFNGILKQLINMFHLTSCSNRHQQIGRCKTNRSFFVCDQLKYISPSIIMIECQENNGSRHTTLKFFNKGP